MTTARLFKLGNAQAVRIPARFRIDADEVEVFKRGDEIILRPKATTAADVFARARAVWKYLEGLQGPQPETESPAQGTHHPSTEPWPRPTCSIPASSSRR